MPFEAPEPSFGDRIGGRWAISLRGWLISIPVSLLVVTNELSKAPNPVQALAWILVALVGALAAGVYGYALHVTWFRHRRERPMPVVPALVAFGLGGLVMIGGMALAARALGLTEQVPWGQRALILVPLAAWWTATLALILDTHERVTTARRELIEQRVQVELMAVQHDEIAFDIRERLRAEIADELDPARVRIERALAGSATSGDLAAVSVELRRTAELSVRSMSRRLWQTAAARYPSTPWGRVLANTVRSQPLRPFALAAIALLTGGMPAIIRYGPAIGWALIVAGIGSVLVISFGANWLMSRHPSHHAVLFIAAVALIQVDTLVVNRIERGVSGAPFSPGLMIGSMLSSVMFILLTSGFGSWRDIQRDLDVVFDEELQADRIAQLARNRRLTDAARDAARVLHGSVQTRLIACAMAIDRASASGDDEALNLALLEARTVLESPIPEHSAVGGVAEEIARKVGLWSALCEVSVVIEPGAESSGCDPHVIGRVVEECLANAIRHGAATRIEVRIEPAAGGALRVTVTDNGSGPGGGRPALGSAVLDQATAGRWSLVGRAPGSVVTALVD